MPVVVQVPPFVPQCGVPNVADACADSADGDPGAQDGCAGCEEHKGEHKRPQVTDQVFGQAGVQRFGNLHLPSMVVFMPGPQVLVHGDVCAEKVDVTHDHKYGEVQPMVVRVRLGGYEEREGQGAQELVFEAVQRCFVKGAVQCHHGPVTYKMNDKYHTLILCVQILYTAILVY